MIGLDFDLLFGAFKVINFSNKAIYVEGPFSLMSVKEDEIKLKLKKGVLEIAGKNLSIKDMQKNAFTFSLFLADIKNSCPLSFFLRT